MSGFYNHTHRHSHGMTEHRHQHAHNGGWHGRKNVEGAGSPELAPQHKHDHSGDVSASPAVVVRERVGASQTEREAFRAAFQDLAGSIEANPRGEASADDMAGYLGEDISLADIFRVSVVFRSSLEVIFRRRGES